MQKPTISSREPLVRVELNLRVPYSDLFVVNKQSVNAFDLESTSNIKGTIYFDHIFLKSTNFGTFVKKFSEKRLLCLIGCVTTIIVLISVSFVKI